MSIVKIRWHWVAGIMLIALFTTLLAIRTGLIKKTINVDVALSTSAIQIFAPKETWMNITQSGRKIGHSHRLFSKTDKGYKFSESVFMRINSMGIIQPMSFKTEGTLNQDMSLDSFDFSLQSSIFNFQMRGSVDGKNLSIYTGPKGNEKKIDIPLSETPYLANSVLEFIQQNGLKPGQSKSFYVFDPASMGQWPVKISVLANERIFTQGTVKNVKKIAIDFMSIQQLAWIGDDGTVVKEKGMLGITLDQVTKNEALRGLASSSFDLTEIASIPADKIIENPDKLTRITFKLANADRKLYLDGDRQVYKNDLLTIYKESLASLTNQSPTDLKEFGTYLEPSPLIQSDDLRIKRKVEQIIAPVDTNIVKATKLVQWIYKNIEKRPVLSLPNAIDTLNNMMGDCNEHAALLTAMARSAGIPAQIEAGLVYQRGKFYYHAWNVLYLGKWITADSVFGQLPADVTHIRLVRGSEEKQIDLLRSIGRLKINIEEYIIND